MRDMPPDRLTPTAKPNQHSPHQSFQISPMDPLTDIKPTADIPAHIAIIMDGNGRWGRSRGMQRYEGHVAGVDAVHTVIEAASEIGVRYLTLYAFSTENWNRPKEEVDLLWDLIISVLRRETPELVRNNVRLVAIGDIRRLPEASLKSLNDCLDANALGDHRRRKADCRRSQGRTPRPRRHHRPHRRRPPLHGRNPRPRHPHPHRRRQTREQFPALADSLLRTLFHRYILARLQPRNPDDGHQRLPLARAPLRHDLRANSEL